MDFLPTNIAQYAENHTSEESVLLKTLNRDTNAKILQSRMLSGHLQGRTLAMIAQLMQAQNILEIGTYTGYASLCLAEALPSTGRLVTIDVNEELEDFTRFYFNQSIHNQQISYIIGDALKIIPTLDFTFDLVFIDADKKNNLNYYHQVFDKVKIGGLIITDNVLWSGKVAEDYSLKKPDKDTQLMLEFNDFVQQDSRVENVLLPIRDGLLLARKISA